MGWFWSQQWIKKGTPISWYWHWDKLYSIVLGSFCSICIRHGQNIVGTASTLIQQEGAGDALHYQFENVPDLEKKIVQSFRSQPDKGRCWIVTCFSMTGKASPDNKSCIVLGLLLLTFSQVLLGWPGVPQWSVDHLRTSHVNLTGNGNKASCL